MSFFVSLFGGEVSAEATKCPIRVPVLDEGNCQHIHFFPFSLYICLLRSLKIT
jgi:hypothetical protein